LVSTALNPSGYSCWKDFALDYQAVSLFKKYPGLDLGLDPKKIALGKFLDAEKACLDANVRLSKDTNVPPHLWARLLLARSFVERVLGKFSWDLAIQYCDFGPGSNVGNPRRNSHQCKKIGNLNPTVTGPCAVLLESYFKYDPHMTDIGSTPRIVGGSTVCTVPKDARTDRVIAIEPLWNMFFQKGIGGLLRSRLRRVGLDLDTGQDTNAELARQGSETGRLATVDLSSASDTICHRLVELLLPEGWYDAMMTVRSPTTVMPGGDKVYLRKFSSMGNGFTFELESLIFLALCKAVNPGMRIGRDLSVFGDDIIIPVTEVAALKETLEFCGFSFNAAKSFWTGPFRESCGKHFFNGHDVTPFYLRKELRTPLDLLWLLNGLKRLAFRWNAVGYGLDLRVKDAWLFVYQAIPERFRHCYCPDGYGDDAIVADFDEALPLLSRPKGGLEGYVASYVSADSKTRSHGGLPALVSKLWYTRRGLGLGEESQLNLQDIRTYNTRFRRKSRLYPLWTSLGPWATEL
jgi:hypothetical protein